ncbi:MAG: hypothetical protein IPP30_13250 [Flavobacterium sp.]|nr:hypothetical protein [Flavobacterium sp.]
MLNNKSPLLDLNIDGFDTNFLFDTGATRSVLIDSTVVPNFRIKKTSSFGSVKGADNKKIVKRLLTVQLNSSLFESNTKVLSFVTMPASRCQQPTRNYSGILGLDVFFENKLSMQLDFTNQKICNINDSQLNQSLADYPYQLIKSKCKWNQIFIYLTIEDKEYKFLLDTGYTGNIILPFDEKRKFRNNKKLVLEGSLFQTISSYTHGQEIVYEKMQIEFAGQHFESKVNVSTSIKAQNIGIDFIKAFDWLIDYNHNKVYVKRNQNAIESNFNRKVMYYAKVNKEKLEIVVKEKSQTKFKVGDQIISINGQKVSEENQCELQDLLNKTEDWNSLQLEVISNSQ